jgi:hypothetical protein
MGTIYAQISGTLSLTVTIHPQNQLTDTDFDEI